MKTKIIWIELRALKYAIYFKTISSTFKNLKKKGNIKNTKTKLLEGFVLMLKKRFLERNS